MAFDFSAVAVPFRMQPGLRRIAPGTPQLTPNRLGDRALVEKLAVLSAHCEQAFVAEPGFDPGRALEALAVQAAAEHPDFFTRDGSDRYVASALGWSLADDRFVGDGPAAIGTCLAALPAPWRLAGLLSLAFAEDFAVIDGARATIPWLAVCLPSSWSPEEKVGRHFTEVHAPVADNAVLLAAADHLARLVTGSDRWERFVWTLTADPHLDRHPQRIAALGWDPALGADALAASAYLRTERQTFIPVAGSRLAVFTIHVEVEPLRAAIRSAADARQLHAALSTMSPAVLTYRGLTAARDRLLVWLEGAAAVA